MLSKYCIILLLLFVEIILGQECDDMPEPVSRNDCFKASSSSYYCCFNSNNNKCISIQKNKLGNLSFLDCGISEENYGKYEFGEYHPKMDFDIGFQTCGTQSPKKVKDCTEYSELSNSCCWFKKGDKTACFSIGKKHDKKNVKGNSNINGNSVEFDCKSFNIIFNLYSILLLLLFIN